MISFNKSVFIIVVVAAGSSVFAAFVDDATTKALWHMDQALTMDGGSTYFLDDDNIFGAPDRPNGRELLLGSRPTPGTTAPSVVANSGPDGSGSLLFDGVNDYGYANNTWVGTIDRLSLDVRVKPLALPNLSDNEMGVVQAFDWRLKWQDDGTGHGTGRFAFWVLNSTAGGWSAIFASQSGLALNAWHTVHAEISNGIASLKVDGVTNSATLNGGFCQTASQTVVGRDLNGTGRYFNGYIDEVRIALDPVPESKWVAPYQNDCRTYGLWHMDNFTVSEFNTVTIADDDRTSPGRNRYMLVLDGTTPHTDPLSSQGPQLVASKDPNFGNALRFDGFNDRLTYNDSHQPLWAMNSDANNFRIEAWVQLEADQFYSGLLYTIAGQPYRYKLCLWDSPTGWQVLFNCWWDEPSINGKQINGGYSNPYGWHHIAAEWYYGQMKIYVDGILLVSYNANSVYGATKVREPASYMSIGDFGWTGDYFWGKIDEVRFSKVTAVACCGDWGYSPGDLNFDCAVNTYDLQIMATQWLTNPSGKITADITPSGGDSVVNFRDIATMAKDWISCSTPNVSGCKDFR